MVVFYLLCVVAVVLSFVWAFRHRCSCGTSIPQDQEYCLKDKCQLNKSIAEATRYWPDF